MDNAIVHMYPTSGKHINFSPYLMQFGLFYAGIAEV